MRFIFGILSVFMVVSCYATLPSCQPIQLSVLNLYPHAITLRAKDTTLNVPARSGATRTLTPYYFYQRCGRIHLAFSDRQTSDFAMVKAGVKDVHIRVNPDGQVEQVGLHAPGFALKTHIEWHGLSSVLKY